MVQRIYRDYTTHIQRLYNACIRIIQRLYRDGTTHIQGYPIVVKIESVQKSVSK